ncbi:hypothetical protein N2152v2_010745 [Parachlorella kessleri]
MGQPEDESQDLEDLMRELSVSDGKSNPFRLFARRAQLVITGLMHISILLLPKPQDEALPSHKAALGGSSGSKAGGAGSSGAQAGGSSNSGAKASAAGSAAAPHVLLAEMQASGSFPADSSDMEAWDRVQTLLEQTSTSRLDWSNCCVYELSEGQGVTVKPVPSYPVSCTSGYYAAEIKGDVLISNDFEKGPHFADWRGLYAAGAQSMAAAPMYVQQKIVGVLNLASRDPHAFDRSRLVWLMAVVLSPFVSALEFTTQRLEMDSFIKRIMPPLLEQNYIRNTQMKRPPGNSGGKQGAEGSSSSSRSGLLTRLTSGLFGGDRAGGEGSVGTAAAQQAGSTCSTCGASSSARSGGGALGSAATEGLGKAAGRVPLGQPPRSPAGSDQFAHNAEVLITPAVTAPGGMAGSGAYLALGHAAPCDSAASQVSATNSSVASDKSSHETAALAAAAPAGSLGSQAGNRGSGRMGRANGRRAAAAAEGGEAAAGLAAHCAKAVVSAPAPTTTTAAAAAAAAPGGFDPLDPYLSSYDSDLDWGDFFFNLISMCIVYAYFSEAAVAGESQAAIVVSMCIAAIDIVLLALRWLWYEQYITYGGAVLQVFQMYRLVVLPVANTWMSWSLLNKLGITPGAAVVAAIGALVVVFLVLGVQMRFFLHAPLQLASVLFAASSTTDVCSLLLSSTTGLGCMSLVSLLQLSVGVVIPSLMVAAAAGQYVLWE